MIKIIRPAKKLVAIIAMIISTSFLGTSTAQTVDSLILNFTLASELDGVIITCPGDEIVIAEKKIHCSSFFSGRELTRFLIDDFFSRFKDVVAIGPWQDVTSDLVDISGYFRTYILSGEEEVTFVLGLVERDYSKTILIVYVQP